MIRVTHAFADEPEVFLTTVFGTEHGVLHVYSADGVAVTHLFNRDSWAAVELLEGWNNGTLYGSSQVEP